MGWASKHISDLQAGKTVEFRPYGNSMTPLIKSSQLVKVAPGGPYSVGDAVLCKVNGKEYLHLIKAIKGSMYQIGNNHGKINGWTTRVYGKVI